MPKSGLGLDLTRQITNVSWGGGVVFVAKGADNFLYAGKISSGSDPIILSLGQPFGVRGGLYTNSSGSFAVVTTTNEDDGSQTRYGIFVMAGRRNNDRGDSGGVILASVDGINWQLVMEQYEVNQGNFRDPWAIEPTGIVWDEASQSFFASFYTATLSISGDQKVQEVREGEVVYTSQDGITWTVAGRNLAAQPPTDDDPSMMDQYFIKPENYNPNGRGFPDGLQGYNNTTGFLLKPTDLVKWSPVNGAKISDPPDGSITIIPLNPDLQVEPPVPGITSAPCRAIAQVNNICIAGGGIGGATTSATVDISSDNGITWINVMNSSDERIDCVVAAPVKALVPTTQA